MSERIFVGTRKGLFDLRRRKGGWDVATTHFLGDPVTAVLIGPDKSLLAALDLGHFGVKLWGSDDSGSHWEERTAPAFPAKPEGSDDPHDWTVKAVWVLERAGPVVWAGTLAGGLFRSEDEGRSWALQRSLWDMPERRQWMGGGAVHPLLHSIAIDPSDTNKMVVGVSTGGVYRSEDGGASWRLGGKGLYAEYMPPDRREDPIAQDVHRIVLCRAKPERMWCQHHNGVFKSADGGMSWQEITAIRPSKFGFAVAVHPADPETAWFVPAVKDECRVPVDAALVVACTETGGRDFVVLNDGLPQRHAYDLIYRHALDIDAEGERLAMGSTTGGFWISENGGASWDALPARLPPVACVRFA